MQAPVPNTDVLAHGRGQGEFHPQGLLQGCSGVMTGGGAWSGRSVWSSPAPRLIQRHTHLAGRTHQLRVHCSALGHPVVGDLTYGEPSGQEDRPFRMMLHAFYLRIPTDAECVEVCTPDPFLPSLDACWSPHTLLQPLDQLVQALRATPDPDPEDRGPRPSSPSTLLPGPGRPPPPPTKPPETEAQQGPCLQWLSEWTLEPDS